MLKFYELSPSPNSTKVRMALRFKGIEFEAIDVDSQDRSTMIEISGQELTPVIEDRGVVLNDSEAILQFLDANYREMPRLYPKTRSGRKDCDDWKSRLDQMVVPHWLPVFFTGLGKQESFDPKARQGFADALKKLDQELGEQQSFKGPEMAICDLRVAEWASYAFPGPGLIERVPLFAHLQELFAIEAGSMPRLERFLEPWQQRLA